MSRRRDPVWWVLIWYALISWTIVAVTMVWLALSTPVSGP